MATADVSYVPGALTAVAGDQCWALVETPPDSPSVTRIWRQLGQGVAADALLASLLADGIGGSPGFTLLLAGPGGRHRLFCRGTVGATVVTGPAGGDDPRGAGQAAPAQAAPVRVDGAGLLTWREQVVENAERIFLGAPPADTALRLPAASGVLLAGCVVVDLTNFAARDTVSYPPEDSSPPKDPAAAERPRKTIVFFPDTLTMTHPGSLAAQASAASLPAAKQSPGDRGPAGLPVPTAPFAGPIGPPGPPGGGPGPSATPAAVAPAAAQGTGNPSGGDGEYDFLWGATQTRSVEEAAMRGPGEGDPIPSGYSARGGVPTAGHPFAAGPGPGALPGGTAQATYPDGPPSAGPGPPGPATPGEMPPGPPAGGMPAAGLAPSPPSPAPARAPSPPGGLIDAPPWLSGPGSSGSEPGPGWGVPSAPGAGWGAPGEQRYAPPAPRADGGPGESSSTVKRDELPEIVARTTPPDRIGPVVPALLCPSGHVNPPSGAVCRRCGALLPHDPVPVPRPVLGVLRLSLGDVITLDRGVLMGRNPRTDFGGPDGFGGSAGEERPHVVKLPSADGDISRTHLRVTLDGWHVLVTDLNSTNGTLVTLPGRDPQQLRPGEPMLIQPGTVVTLADGIDFRYEVTE